MKTKFRLFILVLVSFFSILNLNLRACTCASSPTFCGTIDTSLIIVRVEIIDTILFIENGHHIRSIKIIDNIQKEIKKDTAILLGGDQGVCFQELNIFEVGDTVIFAFIPYINQDSINTYTLTICGKYYLNYSNGRVKESTLVGEVDQDYNSFIEDFQNCLDFKVGTNQVLATQHNIQFAPVPVHHQLRISLENSSILQYKIFHINGQLITSQYGLNEKQLILNWEDWETGLYVVRLVLEDGVLAKVVPKG